MKTVLESNSMRFYKTKKNFSNFNKSPKKYKAKFYQKFIKSIIHYTKD